MLKLKEITSSVYKDQQRLVVASIYADSKEDVSDGTTSADVYGMNRSDVISAGSIVMTADFEIAQMDSDGTWHWADDEEGE